MPLNSVNIRIIKFNDISIGHFYDEEISKYGFRIYYTTSHKECEVFRSELKYSTSDNANEIGSKVVKVIRNTEIEKLEKIMAASKNLF